MTNSSEKTKLPNMNEFSPSVVGELGPLLKLVKGLPCDRKALQKAIFENSKTIVECQNDQHLNRANNVLIGMSECGLYDLSADKLTEYGLKLADEASDSKIYDDFGTHLLSHCYGKDLLEVVRSLVSKGETITLEAIRIELRARGFSVTTNEGNPSKIRLWLEKSGVVNKDWVIDEARYQKLMGISLGVQDEWQQLTRSQRIFLETLRKVNVGQEPQWCNGSHVRELSLTQWGPKSLPEGSLRAEVINPLEETGWLETRGKGEGRGGKIGEIRATKKLLAIEAQLNVEVRSSGIPLDLLKKLDTPIEVIYQDLKSPSKYKKGIALELLCLRLCYSLGLRPVEFRKRGQKTQGAEVDLIAEGIHLHYSRWLFQCKNTPQTAVDVEDLAKEIGMAVLLKAHVVVLVTTGRFTKTVLQYSNGVATETHMQVVLLDGQKLKQVQIQGEAKLVDYLKEQAREALSLKASQIRDAIGEETEE